MRILKLHADITETNDLFRDSDLHLINYALLRL